eukprot:13680-Eustigmatos_ZCMA.PRE.1
MVRIRHGSVRNDEHVIQFCECYPEVAQHAETASSVVTTTPGPPAQCCRQHSSYEGDDKDQHRLQLRLLE